MKGTLLRCSPPSLVENLHPLTKRNQDDRDILVIVVHSYQACPDEGRMGVVGPRPTTNMADVFPGVPRGARTSL